MGISILAALAVLSAAPAHAAPEQASPSLPSDLLTALTTNLPGVVSLPSGLKYKIVRSGPATGPHPAVDDAIKVSYEGKLTTGEVFDSTFARGKPTILMLRNLVPAWMEAIPLMRPGDDWTLYVPAALGYGEDGAGPIPPNSVLVFRIQLLGVLSAQ